VVLVTTAVLIYSGASAAVLALRDPRGLGALAPVLLAGPLLERSGVGRGSGIPRLELRRTWRY